MKKILSIILTLTMVLGLAACSGSEGDTQEEEGFAPSLDTELSATINVVGPWGNFEALDQVAVDFQEYYPNVEVVYSQLSDVHNDLSNRCVTGKDIDLFMLDWYNPEYPDNEGLTMDFENVKEYAEDVNEAGIDISNLDEKLLKSGQVDGKQLMIPIYTAGYGYIVNLDIFEKNNIDVPTSYEELKDCLAKLKEAGYENPLYVNSGHLGKTYIGLYMDKLLAGEDEETALSECISEEQSLYDAGYLNMEGDTLDDNYEALLLRFFEGDIPMIAASANTFSGAAKREAKSETFTDEPFSYAYVPVTFDEEKGPYKTELSGLCMGIYKDTEQIDLVNEFVKFMLTDEEMLVLQNIKHMPTSNANNGTETFPYLQSDKETFCAAEEGISVMDEQIFTDCISQFVPGGDSKAAMDKLGEF